MTASLAAEVADAPRVVWLDDDPTGTQVVRDLVVLTRWAPEDVAWALQQGGPGFFVLTNTRSLAPADAAARVREVVTTCLDAAERAGVDLVLASRGDSTLRGHFPLEVDVVAEVLAARGRSLDGLVLAPAFPSAGRVTVDGVHHVRTPDGGLQPVAETESARDATFGYRSSDLADWVREKSGADVDAVALTADTAAASATAPASSAGPRGARRVLVVDASSDDDLRAAAAAVVRAERAGRRFVYHVGPAFVGARSAQEQAVPVPAADLASLVGREGAGAHGLVVVGSHVDRTTRQLDRLLARRDPRLVELDVARVLADTHADDPADDHVAEVAEATVAALAHGPTVLRTSRVLVTGADADASLDVARRVSRALSTVVSRVVDRQRPAYVVAKGGITSSDLATDALGIRRARVVGPMLPGLVSLWLAEDGPAAGLPYVVFAGNVGDDDALADVVDRLETP